MQADLIALAERVEARVGQSFDGEATFDEAEVAEIAQALRALQAERDEAKGTAALATEVLKKEWAAHRETLDRAQAAETALTAARAEIAGLRKVHISVVAALAAAISLLERTPATKRAAPSNRMFDQMLVDYRKALSAARALAKRTEQP